MFLMQQEALQNYWRSHKSDYQGLLLTPYISALTNIQFVKYW